jgi:outer membrane receptor protein involved in Fe transport
MPFLKSLFTALLLLTAPLVFAQRPAGEGGPRPADGLITGTVVEGEAAEAVPFAGLSLFSSTDSALVTGTTANLEGHFSLERISFGSYYLKVTVVGQRPHLVSGIVLGPEKSMVNLGKVKMGASAIKLKEVEIIGQKNLIEYGLDKQVINVDKSLVGAGGSAVDVLKDAPSVTVDIDGNVAVRGSTDITVFIDGKPSGITGANRAAALDQIPASSIERIELMTNPSSKYDASGMGGIINVILKKQQKPGYNALLSGNVGTRDKYNGSAGLNYRIKKFNFFTNYDYRRQTRTFTGIVNRATFLGDSTAYLNSESYGPRTNSGHNLKAGFDYQLTESQTLTLAVLGRIGSFENTDVVQYHEYNSNRGLVGLYNRDNVGDGSDQSIDYTTSYRKSFAKKRQELTADVVYTRSSSESETVYDEQHVAPSPERQLLERNITGYLNNQFTGQADYVHPIGERGKLETGYRAVLRDFDTDMRYENYGENTWVLNTAISNRFVYHERIHAGYLTYGNAVKKFSYQLGVRAERTDTRAEQKTTNQVYLNNYLNLFPSAFLTQELPHNHKVQASYSRRINRPGFHMLNPFVNYNDPRNTQSGNPELQPELINAFELSHLKYWEGATSTATVFYRHMTDLFQRYRVLLPDGNTNTMFINLSSGNSYGVELAGSRTLLTNWKPWLASWKINGNLSAFRTELNGSGENLVASSMNTWTARLSTNLTVWKKLEVQFSGNYNGEQVTIQGKRKAMYFTEIGLKKDVLQGRGSVNFRLSDPFNTMRFEVIANGEGFTSENLFKRESRVAFIGFTYKLNRDTERQQQRERRRENESSGGDEFF